MQLQSVIRAVAAAAHITYCSGKGKDGVSHLAIACPQVVDSQVAHISSLLHSFTMHGMKVQKFKKMNCCYYYLILKAHEPAFKQACPAGLHVRAGLQLDAFAEISGVALHAYHAAAASAI